MTETTFAEPPEEEGQLAVPGIPPGPSFEGLPVSRYRASLSGMSGFPAPGELKHGDRGYLRVYFKVVAVDYPLADREKDESGAPLIGRLLREHGLTGVEAEFETVEDRFGNTVKFTDGQREVG